MPRNGSGTYERTDGVRTGADVFQQEDSAGIGIEANLLDNEAQDMADALTQSLSKDGQTLPTNDLPMNNFKHTNVANTSSRDQYAKASQLIDGRYIAINLTGTDNYVGNLPDVPITAYASRMFFVVTVNAINTVTNPTINIDGVGVKTWFKGGGAAWDISELRIDTPYIVQYDATLDGFTTVGVPRVDDIGIEWSGGNLRLKDGGVTVAKTSFMNNVDNFWVCRVRSDGDSAAGGYTVPAGWVSSKLSQGNYRVEHTIGNSGFIVIPVAETPKYNMTVTSRTSLVFEVQVNDIKNTPANQDSDWMCIVAQF